MATAEGSVAAGERTKYKALVRYMQQTVFSSMGKELPEDGKVATLSKIAEISKVTTTRADRRFPNTNQLNNCWTALNEYQLCVEKRGASDLLCVQRGRDYSTVCPSKWVEDWKSEQERGASMMVGKAFLLDRAE